MSGSEHKKKVVDSRFAKSAEYGDVIKTIETKGECPFCPDNFIYHKEPILKREGGWFLTRNSWPYANARHHFLVICETHKEKLDELTDKDWQSLAFLFKWAISEYQIEGGGLAMRFGETTYTGATVCHLHAHLIVPELNTKTGMAETVQFPIG